MTEYEKKCNEINRELDAIAAGKPESGGGIAAKTISKVFKVVAPVGLVTCAVLKWVGVLPNASVGEICAVWGAVYGFGAGTIDINLMLEKFTGGAR